MNKLNEDSLDGHKLNEDSLDGHKLRDFLQVKKNEVIKEFSKGLDESYKQNIHSTYLKEIGMKRIEQKWYNLDGKTNNFKKLCSNLNLSIEYDLIYATLSTATHAKDAIRNFLIGENRVDLIHVMKNKDLYLSFSELYIWESVKFIYNHYGLKRQWKNFNFLTAINYRYK